MNNEIDRRSFLSSLSVIPIAGLLEFKEQSKSNSKIRPRLTKKQREKVIKEIRKYYTTL